jgi:16S rRNA (cytidine1402-2'-O)-methyltransferase
MGNLYVVATPIGNLSDISARALETLGRVAVIACEDTRTSKTLLARHGITTRTVSLHRHNEESSAVQLIDRLRAGEDVALISDAGTPGVSDPGARLVALARREGVPVIPVPGANAASAAWSVSGFTDDRFLFAVSCPVRRRRAATRCARCPTSYASSFMRRRIACTRPLPISRSAMAGRGRS